MLNLGKNLLRNVVLCGSLFVSFNQGHTSTPEQRALQKRGIVSTPENAKVMYDQKLMPEYLDQIKSLDMTADEYIAEKTAVASDTYGTTAANRKLLPYIKAKALYNKLTSNDTTALTGGVTKAQAIAVLNAAITAGIPVNMIKKGGLIGIEAAHKLAGAGGLALPADEIHLKAMHYLLTSDKTPAVKLLGNATVIGSPHVNAVIALTTHDTTGSHGANPLPWDKVNAVNVLAVADASHGAHAVDPEALKVLLWAVRNGWSNKESGQLAFHIAETVTDHDEVQFEGNKLIVFKKIWDAPGVSAVPVADRMNAGGNTDHFIIYHKNLNANRSTLDKGGKLAKGQFIVYMSLIKAKDSMSVKPVQAGSPLHNK